MSLSIRERLFKYIRHDGKYPWCFLVFKKARKWTFIVKINIELFIYLYIFISTKQFYTTWNQTHTRTDWFIFSCIITWLCSLYRFIQSSSQMGLFYLRQDWKCHNFQAISTIYLFDHQAASVDSPLLILMFSKCDFPFRLREKKSLT